MGDHSLLGPPTPGRTESQQGGRCHPGAAPSPERLLPCRWHRAPCPTGLDSFYTFLQSPQSSSLGRPALPALALHPTSLRTASGFYLKNLEFNSKGTNSCGLSCSRGAEVVCATSPTRARAGGTAKCGMEPSCLLSQPSSPALPTAEALGVSKGGRSARGTCVWSHPQVTAGTLRARQGRL